MIFDQAGQSGRAARQGPDLAQAETDHGPQGPGAGQHPGHFAKFVPLAVRRLVEANPEAPALEKQEQDVSVLFLDMSGYTRLSQQLTPTALNT